MDHPTTLQPFWEFVLYSSLLLAAWVGFAAYVIVYGCYEWRAIIKRVRQWCRPKPAPVCGPASARVMGAEARQNVRVSR